MDTAPHPMDSIVEDVYAEACPSSAINWFDDDQVESDTDVCFPDLDTYSDTEDEKGYDEYGFSKSPTRHEVNNGEPLVIILVFCS